MRNCGRERDGSSSSASSAGRTRAGAVVVEDPVLNKLLQRAFMVQHPVKKLSQRAITVERPALKELLQRASSALRGMQVISAGGSAQPSTGIRLPCTLADVDA